ncbi:MAG: putative 4,5-dihydroxyphthalate dehydrogenase [Pelotomaculum sp. PtaU1.Bin035]|nr:MAG: putative 4,5-dihydroxyphthalate dehydrogenase [Pelotomaculum sp. PtaU1.Bin035]
MHAEEILALPQAELAAVCDVDQQVLQCFSRRYRVTGFRDYAEMLGGQELDVVVICTPSGLHAKMGAQAARAGKHVLVEKPMALTLEDADMLIDACEKEGVLLSVVLQNRFKRPFQMLKLAMDDGRFGKLSHAGITVRWNRDNAYFFHNPWRGKKAEDGGVIMNQAIHSIDILHWLMGAVESVFAYTATRYRPIEAEDVGVAVLKFKSGALGVIEAASTVYPRNLEQTIAVFGEKGTVVIGGEKNMVIKTWRFSEAKEKDKLFRTGEAEDGSRKVGHQAVLKDMVRTIKTGGRLAVDGREGKKSLEIVLGIYRSSETGMPVSVC